MSVLSLTLLKPITLLFWSNNLIISSKWLFQLQDYYRLCDLLSQEVKSIGYFIQKSSKDLFSGKHFTFLSWSRCCTSPRCRFWDHLYASHLSWETIFSTSSVKHIQVPFERIGDPTICTRWRRNIRLLAHHEKIL